MYFTVEELIKQSHSLIKPIPGFSKLYKPNYNRNIVKCLPTAYSCLNRNFKSENTLFGDNKLRPFLKEILNDEIENIIFIILDSLGFNEFLKFSEILKEKAFYFPISSVFPTITSSAITSIHTGSYPEQHGILGYKILFDELGLIINTLRFSTEKAPYSDSLSKIGIDMKKLIWRDSLHLKSESDKILDVSLYQNSIARSGLSTIINQSENTIPYANIIDGFSIISKILKQSKMKLIHIYTELFDLLFHKYGINSYQSKFGFEYFEGVLKFLKKIVNPKIANKTVLMMVSDHGQQAVNPNNIIKFTKSEVKEFSKILRSPPGKSGRTLHFYSIEDKIQDVYELISSKITDEGYVFTFDQISNIIKFKNKDISNVRRRLGDVLVLLTDNNNATYKIESENDDLIESYLLGQHGSLSFEEVNSFCGLIKLKDI
jgi:hypothetical protein